ncbi:MAG: CehA/McbA family metallohydrolase [Polyangiaceae bacterium]
MKSSSKLSLAMVFALACSSSEKSGPPADPCAAAGLPSTFRFETGSVDGHADPFGAKAAGQARAGKVTGDAMIVRAPDAKAKIRAGDYVLANDRIAVYIAAARVTDGYLPFGGEIISLEPVGDDGRPRGVSQYEESLISFSKQALAPENVTVLNDGSDGKAAVVRASGVLANVPLLNVLGALFRDEYNFPAAIDYVLEPGSEKLKLRLSLANISPDRTDFLSKELHGFLQNSRSKLFTPNSGYDSPTGDQPFVVYESGGWGFSWRMVGRPMQSGLDVSSFQYFNGGNFGVDACAKQTVDYVEIVPGGPELDGVLTAVRRAYGETSQREVVGKVAESTGDALADAWVLALDPAGKVLSRTKSGADGRFVIHVPANAESRVVAAKTGFGHIDPVAPPPAGAEATLTMPPRGTLVVHAKESGSNRALPVRVQVIPSQPLPPLPTAWGITEEANGRVHLVFPANGEATLPLPPGEHRVVVTRGYEYEMVDQKVVVEAGKTATVDAVLAHSVDSTGIMCADFHEHSLMSPDALDAPELKVRAAVADGLDIPVSSEHEYVLDFQPIVESLGLTDFAFGMPSEELSTWTIGHFGVVPKIPDPNAPNQGAVEWVGKKTAEIFKTVNDLPEKPVLIVNHPHAKGFQGFFTATFFDEAKAAGEGDKWNDAFEAIEVFNDSDFETNRTASVASWFALLNSGKNVVAVGNSDSHVVRTNPVGYPRTCFKFGHDDPRRLTREAVRDALRSGNGVVSGGLSMTVTGPDGKGPGEKSAAGAYSVVVQAPSFIEAKTLEVIVDGVTQKTIELTPAANPTGPAHRYEATVDVQAASSRPRHWVVFHAKGPAGKDLAPLHPGRMPFAMSNPVYF